MRVVAIRHKHREEMKKNDKTPMLDKDIKKEQKVGDQQNPVDSNSNEKDKINLDRGSQDNVPESNDPAGYSEDERVKKSPYKKGDS